VINQLQTIKARIAPRPKTKWKRNLCMTCAKPPKTGMGPVFCSLSDPSTDFISGVNRRPAFLLAKSELCIAASKDGKPEFTRVEPKHFRVHPSCFTCRCAASTKAVVSGVGLPDQSAPMVTGGKSRRTRGRTPGTGLVWGSANDNPMP